VVYSVVCSGRVSQLRAVMYGVVSSSGAQVLFEFPYTSRLYGHSSGGSVTRARGVV
jgi:hypothetical protein